MKKIVEKISKINKFILKNNEQINEKLEFINKHIFFLFKELSKINKEKEKNKLKGNIILKPSNSFGENINLKDIYISNNSIMPLKKSFDKSVKISDKSNNVSLSESKNIKKNYNNINNINRVISITHNKNDIIKNDSNDLENYCFILNKIEPYLIKKFSN